MGAGSRPSFASDFPRDAALDELVEAFARGDYARVRSGAVGLTSAENAAVREAAKTLLDRTKPDPLAKLMLALTAALLLLVSVYWAVNGKAPAHQTVPGTPPIERVRSP
jgi:hypothetical protein